jgi:Ca2+-binding EF-hand superfamily protein
MLRGDVNNDGAVNMKDIIDILNSHAFNAFSGTARYKPYMDMDANGRIDMRDILAIVLNFSKRL